jgi:hypothetical protein
MSELLPMWTVYDHPKDFPNSFVARLWNVGVGGSPIATNEVLVFPELEAIRLRMRNRGLTCLARSEYDDPNIVEVWL